jgi:hypothetical protein
MEKNKVELNKLTKTKLIELIEGYKEKVADIEECQNLLRVDSVRA